MFLRVAHLCSGFSFCSKEVERAKKETAAGKCQEKRKREGAQQVGRFEKSQYSVRQRTGTVILVKKRACVGDTRECNERVTFLHPLFGPFPSLSKFCNAVKVNRRRKGIGVGVSGQERNQGMTAEVISLEKSAFHRFRGNVFHR